MPETAAFDGLARKFFSGWLRVHPQPALTTGIGDYGGLPAPNRMTIRPPWAACRRA